MHTWDPRSKQHHTSTPFDTTCNGSLHQWEPDHSSIFITPSYSSSSSSFLFFFFWVNYTIISIPPPIGAQTHHILFFLGKLYHHRSEIRPTIFSILLDSTVGTIISVLDPLISKIKKHTFQFKQSPKSLTHYSVFLSLFQFQIFHQWCCSSLIGFFRGKTKRKSQKNEGRKTREK